MPRFHPGLALAGALALLAGCGLGGEKARDAAEPQAVTKAQLAAMVLPKAELGTIAQGARPAPDGGAVGNAESADGSLDPNDTGKSLRSAGRLTGQRAYFVGNDLAALRKRGGLFVVGTEVELLEDTVYAAQYLHTQLGDYQRFQGKQADGSRLSGVSGFAVTGVGDEAARAPRDDHPGQGQAPPDGGRRSGASGSSPSPPSSGATGTTRRARRAPSPSSSTSASRTSSPAGSRPARRRPRRGTRSRLPSSARRRCPRTPSPPRTSRPA